jgi:hypothetical protein
MPDLLLKRAAASPGEVYDVICEERIVGRIMLWRWLVKGPPKSGGDDRSKCDEDGCN